MATKKYLEKFFGGSLEDCKKYSELQEIFLENLRGVPQINSGYDIRGIYGLRDAGRTLCVELKREKTRVPNHYIEKIDEDMLLTDFRKILVTLFGTTTSNGNDFSANISYNQERKRIEMESGNIEERAFAIVVIKTYKILKETKNPLLII